MALAFGAHVSIAGGVDNAPGHARQIGADTLQCFVKPNRQWRFTDLPEERAEAFRSGCRDFLAPPVAHASYLPNLAAADPELRARSARCVAGELAACGRLGIEHLVLHPGSHGGDGEEAGLGRIVEGLHAATALPGPRIALETTAGTGHHLGWRLEHLAHLLERGPTGRLAVCLDTCHLHAAGYDLSTGASVASLAAEVDGTIGWGSVACVHLNDSAYPAGARRDRHAHLGRGAIGEAGLRAFVSLPRVREVAGVLETPKKGGWGDAGPPAIAMAGESGGNENDRLNLALLREWAG